MLLSVCVFAVLGRVVLAQGPPQCSGLFEYVDDDLGGLMGLITVTDPGGSVYINVTLYVSGRVFDGQQAGSGLSISDTHRSPGSLVFELRFPTQNPVPVIGEILFNGRVLCHHPVPRYAGTLTTLFYSFTLTRSNGFGPKPWVPEPLATWRPRPLGSPSYRKPKPTSSPPPRVYGPPVTKRPRPSAQPSEPMRLSSSKVRCGVRTIAQPLIFNGRDSKRGEWPWVVALYAWMDMTVICASTLISMKHVITAAHCIDKREMEGLIVGVGKYNTKVDNEKNVQYRQIMKMVSHEDYNKPEGTYRNDIAILVLNREVKYNDFARPICLWDKSMDHTSMIDQMGLVVGWGQKEETREGSNIPLEVTVPIVSHEECRSSNSIFRDEKDLVNDFTFCGGFKNGSGPCRGDSGGGLVLSRTLKDGTQKWFLRGIVSVSVPGDWYKCNLDLFTLYTDVAMFLDWVRHAMSTPALDTGRRRT